MGDGRQQQESSHCRTKEQLISELGIGRQREGVQVEAQEIGIDGIGCVIA